MSLTEELGEFLPDDTDKRTIQALKREREGLLKQLSALEQRCDLLTALDGVVGEPPKWLTPTRKVGGQKHYGIANLICSDQHFDEVIRPDEVSGVNAYNRQIAELRLNRTFEKFVTLGHDFLGTITYEGAHIWWNGDGFSGNIHDELTKTNDGFSILDSVEYWLDPVCRNLKMVADAYGKLHVSVRRGNHTRTSYKVPAKGRVRESYDWLFGRLLRRELRDDARITWDIPTSDDGIISQYGTRYLATHGDQFRGGSGISGILTPLSLGNYRKTRRQMSIDQPYDVMILGHFHQYLTIPGVIVNGSLKGYDEYAYTSNFGYEEPQQAFWVTTPEHGPSFHVPIRPMDRKSEGW